MALVFVPRGLLYWIVINSNQRLVGYRMGGYERSSHLVIGLAALQYGPEVTLTRGFRLHISGSH